MIVTPVQGATGYLVIANRHQTLSRYIMAKLSASGNTPLIRAIAQVGGGTLWDYVLRSDGRILRKLRGLGAYTLVKGINGRALRIRNVGTVSTGAFLTMVANLSGARTVTIR